MSFKLGAKQNTITNNKATLRLILGSLVLVGCGKQKELTTLSEMMIADPPKTVSITVQDYCPTTNGRYANLFVANESYQLQKNKIEIDEDWDGVVNAEENNNVLNILYNRKDSNNDGYSDLLMYLSGIRASTQIGLKRCPMTFADLDQDGLSDCEEQYLVYTDEGSFDTDGDMIPDLLELRRGLNPRDPSDALLDSDNDGISGIDEVAQGTPINVTNSEFVSFYSIRTQVQPSMTKPNCFDVSIKNLPIVDTVRGNLIRFYFIEEQIVTGGGGAKTFLLKNRVLPMSMRGVIDRSVEGGTEYEFQFSDLADGVGIQ